VWLGQPLERLPQRGLLFRVGELLGRRQVRTGWFDGARRVVVGQHHLVE
jgi:hypothetical protein